MTAYANQAIDSIMLLVPGDNMMSRAFDICLNSVTP
jgi:hypothetical protein